MNKLTDEEKRIVTLLAERFGDVFYAQIGTNYFLGMDLSTNVWDCYNKLMGGGNNG